MHNKFLEQVKPYTEVEEEPEVIEPVIESVKEQDQSIKFEENNVKESRQPETDADEQATKITREQSPAGTEPADGGQAPVDMDESYQGAEQPQMKGKFMDSFMWMGELDESPGKCEEESA